MLVLSHVNSGRGNDSLMEESWVLRRDSVEGERQRDTETREPDVADGTLAAAEINNQQRGSADKNRSNTFGYQVSEIGQKSGGNVTKDNYELLYLSISMLGYIILYNSTPQHFRKIVEKYCTFTPLLS